LQSAREHFGSSIYCTPCKKKKPFLPCKCSKGFCLKCLHFSYSVSSQPFGSNKLPPIGCPLQRRPLRCFLKCGFSLLAHPPVQEHFAASLSPMPAWKSKF